MAAGKNKELSGLTELARHFGVQPSYIGMDGKRRHADADSLQAILGALGVSLDRVADAGAALQEERLQAWRRRLEPVTVVWGRSAGVVEYRPSPEAPEQPLNIELATAEGKTFHESFQPELLNTLRLETIAGRDYPVKAIPLPKLPYGYHTLRVESGGETAETMVIVAPRQAYEHKGEDGLWGVFLPLYALNSQHSWGAGDLGDFERLVDWTQGLGGSVVATLPLLATFLDEPFEPSPYVPASRLFWNEFYIDMERIPELQESPAARAIIAGEDFQQALRTLRAAPNADYRGVMELKERVLRELALEFFSRGESSPRFAAFQEFTRQFPAAGDYAAFRAACRAQHGSWHTWPESMKQGELTPADYDEETKRYYLYSQFIVQEQMDRLSEHARRGGPGLYLDLPLGVNPDSYDVWRQRDSFAWGVAGGAPPDLFFSKGQNWGFAPLHPLRLRQGRYRYIIDCVQRLMRQAGVVRIDHVMGLHRLFWVPNGMEATKGVYVSYRADELHAILNVESHRYRSMIVGEDLGTVPTEVRRAMKRHNVHGMYVLQFCIQPKTECLVAPVNPGVVASVNTHDMPSFAGFWQGREIDDQLDLGLIKPEEEAEARRRRAATRETLVAFLEKQKLLGRDSGEERAELPRHDLLRAVHEYLGRGPARMVLVNLEDLWQELRQQNVPGTSSERQNWRHKARFSLEEFTSQKAVRELLEAVARARRERQEQGQSETVREAV